MCGVTEVHDLWEIAHTNTVMKYDQSPSEARVARQLKHCVKNLWSWIKYPIVLCILTYSLIFYADYPEVTQALT